MIYIDVDTAVTVPANIMPLMDDTDFITREVAIVYNQAGMELAWNFVTSAGVPSYTAVTPTTSGVYDWTHVGGGMYKIEIPASGGASINNTAEGVGYFTGICTGVLAWRSPDIVFRAAALNDALIDGGDSLDVNVTAVSGDTTAADNAEAFFDGTGYAGTNNIIPSVTTVTGNVNGSVASVSGAVGSVTGHTPQTGDSYTLANGATGFAAIDTVVDAVRVVTDQMVFTVANQLDANSLSGGGGLDAAGVRTAIGLATASLDTQLADIPTVAPNNASIALILADTADLQANQGNWLTATGFATPTNITAGTITTVTNLTNAPTNGDLTAVMKASVTTAVPTAAGIGTQVWATASRALSDPAGFKKNTAVANFMFLMVDSTDHVSPIAGEVVTAERSIDGAAFGACTNAASEVASGMYKISFSAADMNGDIVSFKFTSAGADPRYVTIATET
jgi:hypothetical protein